MGVNRRRGQSQICGDQDIGLRFEDSFGCWMQFINKRRLHELKSFIWCICTASEIERETSFFPISIHTMWIGKLSLWSLRSPPSLQPIPGPRIGWMEPKSLCRIIAFVFILARTLDSRENPFIKLDSDLFSRSRLAPAPSVLSLCTLPRSKSWQRAEESSVNNGTNPFPLKTFGESLSRLKFNVSWRWISISLSKSNLKQFEAFNILFP